MKNSAETAPREPAVVDVSKTPVAIVRNVAVPMDQIPQVQEQSRMQLEEVLSAPDRQHGSSLTLWRMPQNGRMDYHPGVTVSNDFLASKGVVRDFLPAGQAVHLLMAGSWSDLPAAWQSLFEWASAQGLQLAGVNWEIYGDQDAPEGEQNAALYALLA